MQYFRFLATIHLANTIKQVTFKREFGYLKPALRWVRSWSDRQQFRHADIYDLERVSMCWTSRDGLLLAYRTVKPEDALPLGRRLRKAA